MFVGMLFTVFCNAQDKQFEVRNVSPFSGIRASAGVNVYLKQGDDHFVSVEADERFIGNIITETKDGILNVYYKEEKKLNMRKRSVSNLNVHVTAVWIESISTSSGSNLYCQQQLKLDRLTVKSSSGSNAHIDVECRDLTLSVSSGANIKIKGSAVNLTASTSSGSNINARELETVFAILNASSGSNIVVKVTGEIEASASSGSNITYFGNPIPKAIRQSSGGGVRRK